MYEVVLASTPTPTVAITGEMLQGVVDAVTANVAVILPVGIALMGIMLGLDIIPRILKRLGGF